MTFGDAARTLSTIAAGVVLVGNWVYLSIMRPRIQWGGQLETEGELKQFILLMVVVALAGASMIGITKWRDFALVLFGVLIDLIVGRAVFLTPLPLYLDTIGCVLVAVLLGSRWGVFAAGVTSLLLYPIAPAMLPLAIVNMTVAAIAGLLSRFGGFSAPFPIVLSSLFTGVVTTIIATPIALYFAGNITTAEEYAQYSVLENLLGSLFGPPISEGTPSDLLDKLVVFWIVVGIVKLLRKTPALRSFPRASLEPEHHH